MVEPEEGELKGAKAEPCNNGKHCPDGSASKIYLTAKTPWQKFTALELISIHKKIDKRNITFKAIKSELKWLKWLVIALFGAVIISKVV